MTGNALLDKILTGINLTGVAIGAGLYIYLSFIAQRPLPQEKVELARLKEEALNKTTLETLKLDRVTINLFSKRNKLKFLDLEMSILPFKASQLEKLDAHKPIIFDSAIEIAGKMDPFELNSIAGKILLESRIKEKVNGLIGDSLVKKIYFTKFTIQ